MWRKRWFVKPGLSGLAQINDASSVKPETKLRYDLQYVREQSFMYDLKIVARQIWKVLADVYVTVRYRIRNRNGTNLLSFHILNRN